LLIFVQQWFVGRQVMDLYILAGAIEVHGQLVSGVGISLVGTHVLV